MAMVDPLLRPRIEDEIAAFRSGAPTFGKEIRHERIGVIHLTYPQASKSGKPSSRPSGDGTARPEHPDEPARVLLKRGGRRFSGAGPFAAREELDR